MSQQIIPLDAAPNQAFKVTVNVGGKQVPLGVTLRYNETAGYWVLRLADGAGNLLLDSVPLLTGDFPAADFLRQYAYLGVGSSLVLNASGVPAPNYPNNQDLGSDFVLLWEDIQPIILSTAGFNIRHQGVGPGGGGGSPPDIIDDNINLLTNWEKHVGSDIGGNVPLNYGWNQFQPPSGTQMDFYVTGKAGEFDDWLAANHRPVMANVGKLNLSFKLKTDANAPSVAQAIEFDTRLSWAGWNYNFSTQVNYSSGGGRLEISNSAGNWVPTGFFPGKFTPGVWYNILCEYAFDLVARKYSTIAITIGSTRYVIGGGLQNLDPLFLNWTNSTSLQIQEDTNNVGGSYVVSLDNIRYAWPQA